MTDKADPHAETTQPLRVLVVADIWCQIDGLCAHVRNQLDGREGEILVLAPALAGRVHTMTSDLDAELRKAHDRLNTVLKRLEDHGVIARGEVGDPDPLTAIEDVLDQFPAEKILVVTEAEGHQNWRERGLTKRLEGHGIPIHHLTVEHDIAL